MLCMELCLGHFVLVCLQPGLCRLFDRACLLVASQRRNAGVMRFLVAAGSSADVNKPAKDGSTPLYLSAERGHTEGIRILLVAGADAMLEGTKGYCPLNVAVERGYVGVVLVERLGLGRCGGSSGGTAALRLLRSGRGWES